MATPAQPSNWRIWPVLPRGRDRPRNHPIFRRWCCCPAGPRRRPLLDFANSPSCHNRKWRTPPAAPAKKTRIDEEIGQKLNAPRWRSTNDWRLARQRESGCALPSIGCRRGPQEVMLAPRLAKPLLRHERLIARLHARGCSDRARVRPSTACVGLERLVTPC